MRLKVLKENIKNIDLFQYLDCVLFQHDSVNFNKLELVDYKFNKLEILRLKHYANTLVFSTTPTIIKNIKNSSFYAEYLAEQKIKGE
jgi:hypothetical protein